MARRIYGSLNNRFEENKMFCKTIEVGTGMTEYLWSDRHAYEVTAVKDQKHVTVREYDHKNKGGAYSNDWELVSNPEKPEMELTKRGNYWYWTVTATADMLEGFKDKNDEINTMLWLCHNNINKDDLKAKGKITRYHRANVSFGVADYYYDYEF